MATKMVAAWSAALKYFIVREKLPDFHYSNNRLTNKTYNNMADLAVETAMELSYTMRVSKV